MDGGDVHDTPRGYWVRKRLEQQASADLAKPVSAWSSSITTEANALTRSALTANLLAS